MNRTAPRPTESSTLPQLDGGWFLTDGGIETVLIFQDGIPLPEFAAFTLLRTAEGPDQLRHYFRRYLDIAAETLTAAGVDMISAITMTTSVEAIGVTRAAARAGRPVAVSFTLETDGRLPSGEALTAAIDAVEQDAQAEGHAAPAYFMLNCLHPTHAEGVLAGLGERRWRIRGVRANASTLSHAELDVMTELDAGDPIALARA